ncbi:hypothetical protein N8642_04755 [bacterium]|nr:hypothetical protein [bacterium]
MCTVTFIPSREGYRVGMNRDEHRTRVKGVFSGPRTQGQTQVVGPAEPTGGMWIGANSFGVTYALLNWYSRPFDGIGKPISRGKLVESVAWLGAKNEVQAYLVGQELKRFRPFRLVGVFGAEKKVSEWCWDGIQLGLLEHSWKIRHWASSGFDELGAQQARRNVFESLSDSSELNGSQWLRSFHRSHLPEKGAMSVCMHRSEAATVSYTDFVVESGLVTVNYFDGPPCEVASSAEAEILLVSS